MKRLFGKKKDRDVHGKSSPPPQPIHNSVAFQPSPTSHNLSSYSKQVDSTPSPLVDHHTTTQTFRPEEDRNENLYRDNKFLSTTGFIPNPNTSNSVCNINENIKLEIPSEYYEIKSADITYGQQLGEGGFGTVYEGIVAGQLVAIKKLKIQELNEVELGKFKKEVILMCKLRHPNIVLLLGACMKPGELAIITEILKCSMKEIIHSKRDISLQQKLIMTRDTALAMNWLHKRDPPILHLDLKPDNLLIDDVETLRVKVTDFGLSVIKMPGKSIRRVGGTRRYMSPEAMQKQRVDERADVYSFGIVVWELYTRSLPYKEFNKLKDEEQKLAHTRLVCIDGKRPELPPEMPSGLATLLAACWHGSPSLRPTFENIISTVDEISVDTSISDASAAAFWKLCSPEGKGSVSLRTWKDFMIVFVTKFASDISEHDKPHLRKLLLEKQYNPKKKKADSVVSLERFGHVVDWFGPFEPSLPQHPTLIQRIRTLMDHKPDGKNKLFHPLLTPREAEGMLKGQVPGTYLLRTSVTRKGEPFTLSRVTSRNTVKHHRLEFDPIRAVFSILLPPSSSIQNNQPAMESSSNNNLSRDVVASGVGRGDLIVSSPGTLVQDFISQPSILNGLGLLRVHSLEKEGSALYGYEDDADDVSSSENAPAPTNSNYQ
eukprot:TRINITY_DN2839_c0_g2_i4.p2 TRINITY_DN2839_c0_g2~~TRINITY_DN2839_c0_g2_i4.p2  ORF type:complete len:658 (-),score=147.92 TRINITY_DN2839_c0_g2_i4:45-2018(-)